MIRPNRSLFLARRIYSTNAAQVEPKSFFDVVAKCLVRADTHEEKVIASQMKKIGFKMRKKGNEELTTVENLNILQNINASAFQKAAELYYSLFFEETDNDPSRSVAYTQDNANSSYDDNDNSNPYDRAVTRINSEAQTMTSKDAKDIYDLRLLILGCKEFGNASRHQNMHGKAIVIPKQVPLSQIFPSVDERRQEITTFRNASKIYSPEYTSVYINDDLAELPASATEQQKVDVMKDICSRFLKNYSELQPNFGESGYIFQHYLHKVCYTVLRGSAEPEESSHSFAGHALFHSGITAQPHVHLESRYMMSAAFSAMILNKAYDMAYLIAEPDFAVFREVTVSRDSTNKTKIHNQIHTTYNQVIELATMVKPYKPGANFGQVCLEALVAAHENSPLGQAETIHIIPHICFHGPCAQLSLFAIPQKYVNLVFTIDPSMRKEQFLALVHDCSPVCYTAQLGSKDPKGYNFLLKEESQKAFDLLRIAKLIADMSEEEKRQLPIYKQTTGQLNDS